MNFTRDILINYEPCFHVVADGLLGRTRSRELANHIDLLDGHFREGLVGAAGASRANIRRAEVCFLDELFHDPRAVTVDAFGNVARDWRALRERRRESPVLRFVDDLFEEGVVAHLLQNAPFPLCEAHRLNFWVTQLTRYGAGGFYRWHKDRIDSDRRMVSMTYYPETNQELMGGDLLISSGLADTEGNLIGGTSAAVRAKGDRLVVFGANTSHCVSPVQTHDESAGARRIAIVVWAGWYS